MKLLLIPLVLAAALPAVADISLGFGNRRPVAPAEPATPAPDLQALPQAVQAVAGPKAAAAAEKQLTGRRAAMEQIARRYDAAVQQAESAAPTSPVPPPPAVDSRTAPPLRPLPQELAEPQQ